MIFVENENKKRDKSGLDIAETYKYNVTSKPMIYSFNTNKVHVWEDGFITHHAGIYREGYFLQLFVGEHTIIPQIILIEKHYN